VRREVHRQSRGTYGRPRLVAALRQSGYRSSPKRVARLMRAFKLRGVQRGSFHPQTTQSADRTPAPNLLLRREAASVPGQVWVADITFIPTKEGWLYLAGVMDQGSRRVLGLAFDTRLDASLCLERVAPSARRPGPARGNHSSITATKAINTPAAAIESCCAKSKSTKA
jgi:transposase InsO family protein